MPCPGRKGRKHRKHTPIVSKAQFGLFGAEYRRRKRGLKGRMPGITVKELRRHLREARGKVRRMPYRAKKGRLKGFSKYAR